MVAEVAFQLGGRKKALIVVPVDVNRRGPFRFLLDTGAAVSFLSPRLAEELEITPTDAAEGIGAAGQVSIPLATIESLAVGSARCSPMTIGITSEIDRIGTAIGERLDGDLGHDFLRDYRVEIDYRGSLLRLLQGSRDAASAAASPRSAVAFQLANVSKPLVLVPVHVNGRGPFTFILDTGTSSTVLSPALAEDLGLETSRRVNVTGVGSAATQATMMRLASLGVGDARVEDFEIAVSGALDSVGEGLGARIDGMVGYNFLRRFRVTIDYPNAVLGLVPAE